VAESSQISFRNVSSSTSCLSLDDSLTRLEDFQSAGTVNQFSRKIQRRLYQSISLPFDPRTSALPFLSLPSNWQHYRWMILPILFLPHLGSPGEATRVIPASSASVPTSRLSKVLWTAEAPLSCGVLGSKSIAFRPAAALQVPTKSTVLPIIPPLAGSHTLTPSTPSPSRWGPVAHVWVSPLAEVPLRVLIDSVIPLRACELLQIGSDPRIEKRSFRCVPRGRPAERASELASAQSASVRRAQCWVAQRHSLFEAGAWRHPANESKQRAGR
jgi:hypothetical protein